MASTLTSNCGPKRDRPALFLETSRAVLILKTLVWEGLRFQDVQSPSLYPRVRGQSSRSRVFVWIMESDRERESDATSSALSSDEEVCRLRA